MALLKILSLDVAKWGNFGVAEWVNLGIAKELDPLI